MQTSKAHDSDCKGAVPCVLSPPLSRSIHCSTPLRSGEVDSWLKMGPSARMLGAISGDSSGMESAQKR
jgi:hypothetical protein